MGKRKKSNKKPTIAATAPKKLSPAEQEEIASSVDAFQAGIDKVRGGRTNAGFKIFDMYHDWLNSIVSASITLGTGLVALSTLANFDKHVRLPYFWAGVILLLANGLYILLSKKRLLEKESMKAAAMGYETEYYLLYLRNRTQDVIKGRPVDPQDLIKTKDTLIAKTVAEIDDSYAESGSVDHRMDLSILALFTGLALLGVSTLKNDDRLVVAELVIVLAIICYLTFTRYSSKAVKAAIEERNSWLEKIKAERTRT